MKFNSVMNNFTSGEWSEKMYGRSDTDQYFKACRTVKNAFPKIQGGAFKRPGSKLLGIEASGTYAAVTYVPKDRLDSSGEVLVFEFTLSDGSQNTLFITEDAPNATDGWCVATGLDVDGATRMRGVIPQSTASSIAWDLSELEIKQFGDVLVLADGTNPPAVIKRDASTLQFNLYFWRDGLVSGTSVWERYPYQPIQSNGSSVNLTATGTFTVGGSLTLTASAAIFTAAMDDGVNFGEGHIFKLTGNGNTGVVAVRTYTNSTTVTCTVLAALTGLGASPQTVGTASGTAWEQAAWGGGYGWPRTITGYQGALYFGGSSGFPDTVWRSRVGNIYDFMEVPFAQDPDFSTFTDDNSRPWTFTPNTDQVSEIVAMSSSKSLVLLTAQAEIVLSGSVGALGPNDFNAESSTFFGSENVTPVRVGNYLTFVQKGGRLRDLIFSFDENQYKSNDLGFTSDHLGTITKMASAEYGGSSILFAVTSEGDLLSCTLERDYQVTAWALHEFDPREYNYVTVVDIGIVDKTTVRVLLRFHVEETYTDGAYEYTYEELADFYEGDVDVNADLNNSEYGPYLYMDGARSIARPARGLPNIDTVDFGATYFANATVHVFGMKSFTDATDYTGHVYLGTFTANASGVISDSTFDQYDIFTIGYVYETKVVPMSIEQGAQYGSPVGKQRRVNDIFFRFYKSLGVQFGNTRDGMYEIPMRLDNVGPNMASHLYTGTYYQKFPMGISRDYEIVVQSSAPHPLNILAIGMEGMTYD